MNLLQLVVLKTKRKKLKMLMTIIKKKVQFMTLTMMMKMLKKLSQITLSKKERRLLVKEG